ncbi:ROK family protein [Oligoflexus tunisiensis]|uniref:ROK family protein n=1 Tax=Oligoflexus tunisiensis TaxID=708132 RepID=UPI00114C85B4|nr:ROK family protein [Oligoflexus tunisiensis]
MKVFQGLDASDIRLSNNNLLLRLLWQHQVISRADLARITGMSRPSISAIVAEHLDLGLISEIGPGESSGGRRPVLLRFEDDAHLIAGLDFGASHMSLMLSNLRGQEVEWLSVPAQTREFPEQSIQQAMELLKEGITLARRRGRKVIGLGIGVTSPVYSTGDSQSMHPAIHPKWAGLGLSRILKEHVSIPIFMENDANLGALAELWWTERQSRKHLLYLKVASGLGAGVIIDGKIFAGAHGLAGELGHTFLADRRLNKDPTLDNLNAMVGIPYVLEELRIKVSQRQPGVVHRGALLKEAYESGDASTRAIVEKFIHRLALAIANAMVSFDPELVIVGGIVPDLGDELLGMLREDIPRHLVWPELRSVPLECSRFGEKQTALGAATLVLEKMLEDFELFCEAREQRIRLKEFNLS